MLDFEQSLFIELIRVSLGLEERMTKSPTVEEWEGLYEMAKKHSVMGVCSNGVRKLYKEKVCVENLTQKVFLRWIGHATKIKETNEIVNKQCVKLQKYFQKNGFECSILKGQGIATLYRTQTEDLSLLRQSGDIDIWVKGGIKSVVAFLNENFGKIKYDIKHGHVDFFTDTEVEVHWWPEIITNPIANKKLQKFWTLHENEIYGDHAELPNEVGLINVPTPSLNAFFILLHTYRHQFEGGVGLRQVMDYYFVLNNQRNENLYDGHYLLDAIEDFGMSKFAAAMMWILQKIFHLEKEKLLCAPDEKEGRFLLNEILQEGNFGKYDDRVHSSGQNRLIRFVSYYIQRSKLWVMHYPKEVFWRPIWYIYHFFWKKFNIK